MQINTDEFNIKTVDNHAFISVNQRSSAANKKRKYE
jgi:hypothetical protein